VAGKGALPGAAALVFSDNKRAQDYQPDLRQGEQPDLANNDWRQIPALDFRRFPIARRGGTVRRGLSKPGVFAHLDLDRFVSQVWASDEKQAGKSDGKFVFEGHRVFLSGLYVVQRRDYIV